ncbi:MAG: hypothetical protein H6831_04170 [Planctomycetes bacterium]|nr:hypothetical protein [Planctomycetota bacterium]MCB9903583.1 hypothetical protein [Planctomycetota bacterium]
MNRRALKLSLAALPLLALAAAASTSAPFEAGPYRAEDEQDVQARYELVAASEDRAAMVALWRDQPDMALVTFDADLERSLSLWEASPEKPPTEEIAKLHRRALFAARAASEALGTPIFADYAASFVSWDDQQKRDFRDGQKIVGASRKALEEGEAGRAVELAMNGIARTSYLGDWWGLAMSHAARGRAMQASSSFGHALTAYSQARQLYHDLHLTRSELANLRYMINMLLLLENWPRAEVACEDALRLARESGAEESVAQELEGSLARVREALRVK